MTTYLLDVNVLIALVDHLSSHTRVTDSYLLALAHAKGGRLATMDQKMATEVVTGGKHALALIQTN